MSTIALLDNATDVHCPICKRPVLLHQVDWDKNTAFCDGCNYSFPPEESPEHWREEIVMPAGIKNIRLTLVRNELTVIVPWFRNYPLWRILQVRIDKDDLSELSADPRAVVATVALLGLKWGAGSFLKLCGFFFNHTRLRVTAEYVWVDHRPVDALPTAFFHARQIKQVFVRKSPHYPGSFQERVSLFLQLKDGTEYDILWDLRQDVLLYLEQEIERILGIEDQEMPDEIV